MTKEYITTKEAMAYYEDEADMSQKIPVEKTEVSPPVISQEPNRVVELVLELLKKIEDRKGGDSNGSS
jgi:hypothetical protein